MSEESYPYIVKKWHACAHQKIPIIFTRKRGVKFDMGKAYIGYPKEPFQEGGILSEECRQFLIELQMRGKLHPLIVFSPNDSIFIDPYQYPAGIKEYHGINFITRRAFLNGKEGIIADDYVLDGRHAAVIIKRTHYGAYLLYLRYKDTNKEQWLQQDSLSGVVEASNKMLGRYDRADEEKPMYRLDRGTLTIDGYPVLKIFGTDSGKRWFVTWCEEVQDVSSSESSPGEETRVHHQLYFGVIRDSNEESWEFWMDEEIEPSILSGEVREYQPDELNFFDVSTFDQIYQEGADPVETVASPPPSPVAGKPDNLPVKKISKRKQKKVQRNRSGSQKKGEVDERIAVYEAKIKSLVDEGRYKEAIEYSEEQGRVLYESDADSCTFYSYKIIGVCHAKDVRIAWSERGYRPPHWIEAGNALFDAGKYEDAIEAYYKRIQEDWDDDRAWYLMGCAYRALGNPYESVEAWDEAFSIVIREANLKKLESDSDSAVSWAERGDIDHNQENWNDAIRSYNNSLSIDSRQQEIWFRKGCAHYQLDEYQEALDAFNQALEINPNDICAANNKGATLFKLKQIEEAKDIFENITDDGNKDDLNMVFIRMNKETLASQKKGVDTLIFITNDAPPPGQ